MANRIPMTEMMRAQPIGTPTAIPMIAPSPGSELELSSKKGPSSSPPPEKMVENAVGDFAGLVMVGSERWNPA